MAARSGRFWSWTCLALASCGSDGDGALIPLIPPSGSEADWVWRLPPNFPTPLVPEDNPMSQAKVDLGRALFFDQRLSHNETLSCAGCHEPGRAFTDARTISEGSTGETTLRNSMSLTNVAYNTSFNWANPDLRSLESQSLLPLLGTEPVELGWGGREEELQARLESIEFYRAYFQAAFPLDEAPITVSNIARALAAFQRTLISGDSPFDRFVAGDPSALGASELRGMELFFSEKLECFHCHGGFNFSQATVHEGSMLEPTAFHNTGLYNVDGRGAYPDKDQGLYGVTGLPADMGRFRSPTLRNIAVTAPYMHDGSVADLDEAMDHYARGGRNIEEGPFAGDGRTSFLKSGFVAGFSLTPDEREDVKAFLRSLTDQAFLSDPDLRSPW